MIVNNLTEVRMAAKNDGFNIPEDISVLAKKLNKARAEYDRAEKKSAQKKGCKLAKHIKNNLPYAKKIFSWADDFRESAAGRELMEQYHLLTAHGRVMFFDGSVKGVSWRGLEVARDGVYISKDGFMAHMLGETVSSSEELAESVDVKILKAACEWIDDGRAWKCVKRHIERLEKENKKYL